MDPAQAVTRTVTTGKPMPGPARQACAAMPAGAENVNEGPGYLRVERASRQESLGMVMEETRRAGLNWPQLGLRVAGAGLLAVTGAIHLDLYLTGYRSIPVIGWLFLLQVIAALGLAAAVLVSGSRLAAAAGAGFALSTLGGYLLSVQFGLFGFKEVRTTAGIVAGVIEVAAFAALALLGALEEPALRQALGICQDLGATATARIIRRKMRKLGIRSIPAGQHTATREHPLGLTRREQEVLDLICAGRTNAEIAAHLVISTRTAGHHVSAVLAKLGVRTRHAAAMLATASPPPR